MKLPLFHIISTLALLGLAACSSQEPEEPLPMVPKDLLEGSFNGEPWEVNQEPRHIYRVNYPDYFRINISNLQEPWQNKDLEYDLNLRNLRKHLSCDTVFFMPWDLQIEDTTPSLVLYKMKYFDAVEGTYDQDTTTGKRSWVLYEMAEDSSYVTGEFELFLYDSMPPPNWPARLHFRALHFKTELWIP